MQPITALAFAPALDSILAFLVPLFLPECDPQAARLAAMHALQAYAARNEDELRLAAQIISFSLRALDALARAADPDLDVKTILRLNSSATSLNRAAMRCRKELDRLRAQPPAQQPAQDVPPTQDDPDEPRATASAAQDFPMEFPRAAAAAAPTSCVHAPEDPAPDAACPSVPRLSRQQRRLAERLAERERRRQPDQARQLERTLAGLRELEATL